MNAWDKLYIYTYIYMNLVMFIQVCECVHVDNFLWTVCGHYLQLLCPVWFAILPATEGGKQPDCIQTVRSLILTYWSNIFWWRKRLLGEPMSTPTPFLYRKRYHKKNQETENSSVWQPPVGSWRKDVSISDLHFRVI